MISVYSKNTGKVLNKKTEEKPYDRNKDSEYQEELMVFLGPLKQ